MYSIDVLILICIIACAVGSLIYLMYCKWRMWQHYRKSAYEFAYWQRVWQFAILEQHMKPEGLVYVQRARIATGAFLACLFLLLVVLLSLGAIYGA